MQGFSRGARTPLRLPESMSRALSRTREEQEKVMRILGYVTAITMAAAGMAWGWWRQIAARCAAVCSDEKMYSWVNPMVEVDLSIRDFDGQAVVALRGELNLADTPGVASHLIAAVAACGPSVIVDLAGLESICYSGLSVLLRVRKWTRQQRR